MIRKISLLFFTVLFFIFILSCTQDIIIDDDMSQFNLQIKINTLSRSVTPLSVKGLFINVKDSVNGAKVKDINWVSGGTNSFSGINIEYNKKYTVNLIHNTADTNIAVTQSVDVELSPGMGAIVNIIPGDTKSLSVTYFGMGDVPSGFTLVWQEDFNTLDTSIWNIQTGWGVNGWGNSELQCYTDRPDNVYIENGNLVIKVIKENYVDEHGVTRSFTSARLNTMNKLSFKYGKIRARIKLPYGKGVWPAFWMLGDSFQYIGWAYCGEIDIMEVNAGDPGDIKNNIVHGTAHWYNGSANVQYGETYTHSSAFYEDYYIFEAEWDGTYIHTRVASTEEELNTKAPFWSIYINSELQAFNNKYFHLLLNVAVGGKFTGIYNTSGITTHMPQKMYVDWIKVYQNSSTGAGIKAPISLLPPSNVSASKGKFSHRIRVQWNPVESADNYYVYRCSEQNGRYESIAITSGTSFDDTNMNIWVTNYYKIKASINNNFYTALSDSDQGYSASGDSYFYLKKWGSYGTGNGEFSYPGGIAVDKSSNVYIADTFNHRIQKFDSDGNYLTQWGSIGSGNGAFGYPREIGIDSSGNIYVTDDDNRRVQKFDSNGNYLLQWGALGSGDGQFIAPKGIAVDMDNNIYVVDHGNNRIQKFDSDGNYITQWGSYGLGNGEFDRPWGITVDKSGNVYVAGGYNHRIQKFDSDGNYITQWGSLGSGESEFNLPQYVAVDTSGYIYVSDINNIPMQKFTTDGIFITRFGIPGSGNGEFDHLTGIAVDTGGYIYMVDMRNHRIQKFE